MSSDVDLGVDLHGELGRGLQEWVGRPLGGGQHQPTGCGVHQTNLRRMVGLPEAYDTVACGSLWRADEIDNFAKARDERRAAASEKASNEMGPEEVHASSIDQDALDAPGIGDEATIEELQAAYPGYDIVIDAQEEGDLDKLLPDLGDLMADLALVRQQIAQAQGRIEEGRVWEERLGHTISLKRSEIARKANASRTPEQRSEASRKANATMRANKRPGA